MEFFRHTNEGWPIRLPCVAAFDVHRIGKSMEGWWDSFIGLEIFDECQYFLQRLRRDRKASVQRSGSLYCQVIS